MNEQFTFFYNGPFSQWYPSKFKIKDIEFNCCEQFMMWSKAIYFKDNEIAEKILNTSNPKTQKAFGRKVKNFNTDQWHSIARDVVYFGNFIKFSNDEQLKKILLATGDTTIVEASPFDSIWGIGLDGNLAKITPPEKWPGTNWLGLELTKVREKLK